MNPEGSSISIALPLFDGKNYHLWVVKMEAYLDASDLWEAVEDVYKVKPLSDNPTVAQIKNHKERKQRKSKAKATLLAAFSSTILARIMTLKTANKIWDFLKQEYEGNEKVKGMQVLNFIQDLRCRE